MIKNNFLIKYYFFYEENEALELIRYGKDFNALIGYSIFSEVTDNKDNITDINLEIDYHDLGRKLKSFKFIKTIE